MNTLVFDLGGTKCDVGVFDENGKLLKKKRILTEAEKGREVVLQQLFDLTEKFVADFKITKCVIGVPGRVSGDRATVIKLPNIAGFENFNLAEIFQSKFPEMECFVENDANLFALGAYASLKEKPEVFVGITFGTGIGGGVIVNGQLVRGEDALAGEFGHIVIEKDGLQCHCGQKGCWEKYASAQGFSHKIESYLQKEKITMEEIAEALAQKDAFIFEMLNETVDFMAIGLANILHTIDPSVIAFGGSLGNLLPYYSADLKQKVTKRLLGKNTHCEFMTVEDRDVQLRGGLLV